MGDKAESQYTPSSYCIEKVAYQTVLRSHSTTRLQAYGHVKFAQILHELAATIESAAPDLLMGEHEPVAARLAAWLATQGLDHIVAMRGGANAQAIKFFRDHDLGFRIRRLRLLTRRLSDEWEEFDARAPLVREAARDAIYQALALYFEREASGALGSDFSAIARDLDHAPGAVLAAIAERRRLVETDHQVDALLVKAMAGMPRELKIGFC